MKRLAIVTTHPIQYYAPVFKLLTKEVNLEIMVFYTWGESSLNKFDPGFGKKIEWDLPLTEGYNFQFLKNTAKQPGSNHFNGIINPDAIKQIDNFKPDAILVFGWAYNSHLKIIRHYYNRIPVWFRGDSTLLDDQQKGLKRWIKAAVLKWVYKHIDKAFYVGQANKAYFLKYGLKEKNLIFAPHAIENSRFEIEQKEKADQIRKNIGINSNDILILFAGKFEPKKNPELLLKAVTSLNNPLLHTLMVGNGLLEDQLKMTYGKKPGVHFMDFQNQSIMPAIYQSCDIFCLPSSGPGETWGLAVNEAMACGKPIIVSNKVGCSLDLVHNYKNGIVFQANDLKGLTLAIENLIAEPIKLKAMGNYSKQIIKEWTFNEFVKSIIKTFESDE